MDKKCGCGEGDCKACHPNNGGACCGMHSMMMGHGCCGGRRHLVKIILKIVIVVLIFWCGFKLGEISGSIRTEYGGYRMGGFKMMQGGWNGYYDNTPISNPSAGTQLPPATK